VYVYLSVLSEKLPRFGKRAELVILAQVLQMYNPEQLQYDEYDGDNDQSMNPTAGLRESWTDVPAEKAE